MPTYWWKNLSIDFMINFPISANWKSEGYNSILIIIDQLIKIVHYKLGKVMIDVSSLAKIIINMVVHYHGVLKSIVTK